MSDEREGAGSPVDATDTSDDGDTSSQTAVVTSPQRPSGKRSRRDGADGDTPATDAAKNGGGKDGGGKKPKTAKKREPRSNPFTFVYNYLKQVVAELRKVIWPNRKQMVTYTSVVLVFLVFMVSLIGGVDLGLAKLIGLVFG